MAVLSDSDRADVALKLIRKAFVEQNQTANLTSAQVRTMVNDIDAWADANQVAFNQAITASVRNIATAEMKALALAWVALKRAGAI